MADQVQNIGGALPHVDNTAAPHVYFDEAPVYAAYNGIVAVTLEAMRARPDGKGGITNDMIPIAFLRCNIVAARALRDALDKALLIAAKPEGTAN